MSGIFSALTWWALSKALAVFTAAVMMVVLIVGIVTSDVGEISLSWKLHDLSVEGERRVDNAKPNNR